MAFDLLAVGGDGIRSDALHARKARLAKLLTKACDGIQYNEHMEGEIGAAMFEHACKLGLEGIVSSIGTVPIALAGQPIGSRSRTRLRLRCGGLIKGSW